MSGIRGKDDSADALRAAETMRLSDGVTLLERADPKLVSQSIDRLRRTAGDPARVGGLWDEAFAAGGERCLALFAAAEVLAKRGEVPDAVSRVFEHANKDVLVMVGYGSIMWQPSEPLEIMFRMDGDLHGWRRTAEIGTYKRGAKAEEGAGRSFGDRLDPDLAETFRGAAGNYRSLGLGLSPAAGESLRVTLDFVRRRNELGEDITKKYLDMYDARESSANADPHDNYYERKLVPIAIGGPASTVEGFVYATNHTGTAYIPGLKLSERARRIIDATPHGEEIQTVCETDEFVRAQALPEKAALERISDRLDRAAVSDVRTAEVARELQQIENWVRANVDPNFDRYRPTGTYQRGVHYWEGVAYGLRVKGASDQHVTNVMMAIRIWQAIARLEAEAATAKAPPVVAAGLPANQPLERPRGRDPPS